MDKIDFLAEQALAWEDPLASYLDWRLKTASGALAARHYPHAADLLAGDEDGEWDTEVFW